MKLENCKVGMRVASYGSCGRVTGRITDTHNQYPDGTVSFTPDGTKTHWIVHPKQLRKLVKKPRTPKAPRVLWVNHYRENNSAGYCTSAFADEVSGKGRIEGRAVRYVRSRNQEKGRT